MAKYRIQLAGAPSFYLRQAGTRLSWSNDRDESMSFPTIGDAEAMADTFSGDVYVSKDD